MKRIPALFTSVAIALVAPAAILAAGRPAAAARPNIVIIFADDLGYGDLGCYGHPTIRTPNLDRMAAEGMRFTEFYAAANVCTPSRAALLTGRLPIRSGLCGPSDVLFPESAGGLPQSEITIARALKTRGYATGMVGKWHLGNLPQYLPTSHGFDSYFGIPYSNNMAPSANFPPGREAYDHPNSADWQVSLLRDQTELERAPDQAQLTRRYTEEAVRFIHDHKRGPFFLYFAHTFPHVPLFASEQFKGRSPRGLYGDTVEELDWSVGQVLDALKSEKITENTLVFFTSDNGPWLTFGLQGGSAGLLRDGKASCWEGGMREPGIAWWPGRIKAGTVNHDIASTMDLFNTSLKLAGAEIPQDRVIDGVDLTPALLEGRPTGRTNFFYYHNEELYAVRKGPYKAHIITRTGIKKRPPEPPQKHDPPLLFNLEVDPGESYDIAKDNPGIVADLLAEIEKHRATVIPVESQLEKKIVQPPAAAPKKP